MKIIKRLSTIIMTAVLTLAMCIPSFKAASAADGTYSIGVSLTGGTGRVVVESPASITFSGGKMTASIVLKRKTGTDLTTYTWMKVNGEIFNNIAGTNENSKFTIPVSALDTPLTVSAYSEVMSSEIEYTLTFHSSTLPSAGGGAGTAQETTAAINNGSNQGGSGGGTDTNNKNSNNTGNTAQTTTAAAEETSEGEIPSDGDGQEAVCLHSYKNGVCELCGEADPTAITIADSGGGKSQVKINGGVNTQIKIPAEAFATLTGSSLYISTAFGTVEFDKDTVTDFISRASGAVSLSIKNISEKKDYINTDYGMVLELSLTDAAGNELFTKDIDGRAKVTIGYKKDVASGENVKVYYITGSDREEVKAAYNAEDKTVTFDVNHFSIYGVAQESAEKVQKGGSISPAIIVVAVVVIIGIGIAVWTLLKRRKKCE